MTLPVRLFRCSSFPFCLALFSPRRPGVRPEIGAGPGLESGTTAEAEGGGA